MREQRSDDSRAQGGREGMWLPRGSLNLPNERVNSYSSKPIIFINTPLSLLKTHVRWVIRILQSMEWKLIDVK